MKCKKCGKEVKEEWKFCNYCGNKIVNNNRNKKITRNIIYVASGIVGIILIISIAMFMINSNSNVINYSQYSNVKSISDTYNLTEEVKEQIKMNWNKISGYGTSDIEKVILDVTRGWLYIVYTDTTNNGLYVHSDRSSGYHYGNEKTNTGIGCYRDSEEKMFSTFLNTWPEQYKRLTKSEFISLLNEL